MKSTDENLFACETWSEYQTNLLLEQDKAINQQDDLRAANKKTIDDEAKRKQSVNMQF